MYRRLGEIEGVEKDLFASLAGAEVDGDVAGVFDVGREICEGIGWC